MTMMGPVYDASTAASVPEGRSGHEGYFVGRTWVRFVLIFFDQIVQAKNVDNMTRSHSELFRNIRKYSE